MSMNIVALLLGIGTAIAADGRADNRFLPEAPASYVAPKRVKLERYVLDEVPDDWASMPGGNLSANQQLRRAGEKGIQWDWSADD